jgi:hypothetical protein
VVAEAIRLTERASSASLAWRARRSLSARRRSQLFMSAAAGLPAVSASALIGATAGLEPATSRPISRNRQALPMSKARCSIRLSYVAKGSQSSFGVTSRRAGPQAFQARP